jgi:hypothetical protein
VTQRRSRNRKPRLNTLGDVLKELATTYRMGVRGALDWQDARHASAILRELRHHMEATDVEERIRALEQRAGIARPSFVVKPNGSGRDAAHHDQ